MIDFLSIIEGVYVIYILRYFKTTQSFAIYERGMILGLFTGEIKKYLTHNIHNTDKPMHHICAFGRDASLLRIQRSTFQRRYYFSGATKVQAILGPPIPLHISTFQSEEGPHFDEGGQTH